jgi:hypothetical protein
MNRNEGGCQTRSLVVEATNGHWDSQVSQKLTFAPRIIHNAIS